MTLRPHPLRYTKKRERERERERERDIVIKDCGGDSEVVEEPQVEREGEHSTVQDVGRGLSVETQCFGRERLWLSCNAGQEQLSNVRCLRANERAFAAIREAGVRISMGFVKM